MQTSTSSHKQEDRQGNHSIHGVKVDHQPACMGDSVTVYNSEK